jgi:polyisoprenoid-binding protein YceI
MHNINTEETMRKYLIIAMILSLAANAMPQTQSKSFYADTSKKKNIVMFTSKAPLETIVGTTAEIIGYVEVNPADLSSGAKARFEVDLASLKTGIERRDADMRGQFLETAKYPKAVFEMTKIQKAGANTLDDQKPLELMVDGNFTVHGITKAISIPLTVTFMKESDDTKTRLPGDLIHIEGTWNILLSEYNIPRPQFLILKVDDKQKVNIDVFASTGSTAVTFGDSISK